MHSLDKFNLFGYILSIFMRITTLEMEKPCDFLSANEVTLTNMDTHCHIREF